jgi:hypothetical protein
MCIDASAWWCRFVFLLGMTLVTQACAHHSDEEIVDQEASFSDAGLVCDRVHDVMKAKPPARVYADLPSVALLLARTQGTSGLIDTCGDELLAWIRRALEARPIDLRPRLDAQVAALGSFLASARADWRRQALPLLAAILLDDSPRRIHCRLGRIPTDMGSQSLVNGWTAIVTSEELDRTATTALVQGYLHREMDDDYADLLSRFFARRFSDSFVGRQPVCPFALAVTTPPPDPDRVGNGRDALDLLWADLGRAFRHVPEHPRWKPLPATLRLRLAEDRPLLTSP